MALLDTTVAVVPPLPIREQVRRSVLARVMEGELAPGEHLRIGSLAATLGVSPTPAREALMQLEREGMVTADPNRGFFVAQLSTQEIQDLFPIVWTLECLALETQGVPHEGQRSELRAANQALRTESATPGEAVAKDERWHRALVRECGNDVLLSEIARYRRRIDRYEHAFMRVSGRVSTSVEQHDHILAALERGDLPEALTGLRVHWQQGMDFLINWLEASG